MQGQRMATRSYYASVVHKTKPIGALVRFRAKLNHPATGVSSTTYSVSSSMLPQYPLKCPPPPRIMLPPLKNGRESCKNVEVSPGLSVKKKRKKVLPTSVSATS